MVRTLPKDDNNVPVQGGDLPFIEKVSSVDLSLLTLGNHTKILFNVVGDIQAYLFGIVRVVPTSTGAGTLAAGVNGLMRTGTQVNVSNSAAFMGTTGVAAFLLGTTWDDTTPSTSAEAANPPVVVSVPTITLSVGTAVFQAGMLDFYLMWRPLESDSNVSPAA